MDDVLQATPRQSHRGVSWHIKRKKWQVHFRPKGGGQIYLGCFDNPEDAVRAYNNAATEHINNSIEVTAQAMQGDPYQPTPSEIEEQCRAIRGRWTEEDYRQRAPHWAHSSSFVRRVDGSAPAIGG